MSAKEYLVCCSFGNDSVALLQHMVDEGLSFDVIYNDTGWAADGWGERVEMISEMLAERSGAKVHITESEGMEALVRRKKGWPMPASKMQFCTQALKERPTLELLEEIDPQGESVCVTGIRREESANRSTSPEYLHESPRHGGRDLWMPLVAMLRQERDELIRRFGVAVLPHSSRECHPCVCANKTDLRELASDEQRIAHIERIEIDMGFTRNEKPRTMFRPYRVGGGVGIRQAVAWGCGPRGHRATFVPRPYVYSEQGATDGENDAAYEENTRQGLLFERQCDGGYCGT